MRYLPHLLPKYHSEWNLNGSYGMAANHNICLTSFAAKFHHHRVGWANHSKEGDCSGRQRVGSLAAAGGGIVGKSTNAKNL